MQSPPQFAPASVQVIESNALDPTAAPCPILAAVKVRAKALKKWRKQERLRFFSGWCAGLHALGFSF